MAHNLESLSDSGLLAELSVSFHDELTASIQSAFSVAGELAVTEVSKVVGKAFRDMRDQLHKTLLANRNLRTRLTLAQTELRSAQSRTPQTRDIAVNTSPNASELGIDSSLDVKQTHEDVPGDSFACRTDSFCEIGEDGIECVKDVKPNLTGEEFSHQLQVTQDIKEDLHVMQEHALHADQVCIETVMVPGASAVQIKGCISYESNHAAKLEEAHQCAHTLSEAEQEFSSESLSMAQSKLLEDWRPEPLHLQSCQSDSYTSSGSSALANPSLLQEELPGMDFLASASSSQPDTCHAPMSRRDASSLNNPASNSHFPTHSSGQGHALGQFSMPEDVHRFRSVMQPKLASHQHKSPKRSLYPPGRSPFRCSQCGRDFNRMEHLKIHQRIHTGEKPYACSECTARFRHSWALTRHIRIHTGEKPYSCTHCGKRFRNCGGLRFHQRTHAQRSCLTNIRPNLEGYGRA
ncbi:zinc finger protein 235 [Tachysurus ichikawai]